MKGKDGQLNEKGAVAVIVVLAITAIFGFGALVLDGGMIHYQKARLQTALDAAVLAGVRALEQGSSAAEQAAVETAMANGVQTGELTVSVDTAQGIVEAEATRAVPMGLARVLKLNSVDVSASSAAGAFAVSGIQGAVPLGVVVQEFTFGELYDLKLGDGENGNYGALALGGTGAANYQENLRHGFADWVRIGQQIMTEPGNMATPTETAVLGRIQDCLHQPPCTFDHFVPGCSRVLKVPITSAFPNGRGEVTVLGFAAFFLEGFSESDNSVQGRFVRMHTPGEVEPAGNYGLEMIKLLR
jgi:hypothetical protein